TLENCRAGEIARTRCAARNLAGSAVFERPGMSRASRTLSASLAFSGTAKTAQLATADAQALGCSRGAEGLAAIPRFRHPLLSRAGMAARLAAFSGAAGLYAGLSE